ncbi:MAG TPA: hypothetical protein VN657_09520 [Nitrospiraceae bacterium]|jgi:hypothetical protein|nr:hypothetical protein [Nitrospiraceae bacterium]
MLKKSAGGVLTSFRPSRLRRSFGLEGLFRSPRPIRRANGLTKCGRYLLGPSLVAALPDELFEHPAWKIWKKFGKIKMKTDTMGAASITIHNCPIVVIVTVRLWR